nr:unnamed protein product [Digitaria exilis]
MPIRGKRQQGHPPVSVTPMKNSRNTPDTTSGRSRTAIAAAIRAPPARARPLTPRARRNKNRRAIDPRGSRAARPHGTAHGTRSAPRSSRPKPQADLTLRRVRERSRGCAVRSRLAALPPLLCSAFLKLSFSFYASFLSLGFHSSRPTPPSSFPLPSSRSPPEGTLASAAADHRRSRMASPARPAAASVSGAFGLSPDPKRCSFDQALRQKVPARRRSARDLRAPPCAVEGLGVVGVLTEWFRVHGRL